MPEQFFYDAFLSYSPKDKEPVKWLAKQLLEAGIRVWYDDWEISSTDNIFSKIEKGLEHSRVLLFCISIHSLGDDWTTLENQTFRFRDPLNARRRFVPLRLDNAPLKSSLAHFSFIDCRPRYRKRSIANLIEICRLKSEDLASLYLQEQSAPIEETDALAVEFNTQRGFALCGMGNGDVNVLDVRNSRKIHSLEGHTKMVWAVAWNPDTQKVLSGSYDKTLRSWDVETGRCLYIMDGHADSILSVAWIGRNRAISCDEERFFIWDARVGNRLATIPIGSKGAMGLAVHPQQKGFLMGVGDTILYIDLESLKPIRVLEGHTDSIRTIKWSADQTMAATGSIDGTIRLWEISTGRCLSVLKGHTHGVWDISWHKNQRFIVSGSSDKTTRLWDLELGKCIHVIDDYKNFVRGVAWSEDQQHGYSGDITGNIRCLELLNAPVKATRTTVAMISRADAPEQVQYTNAKVLLVGESGAGKTGLSKRLALNEWLPSDSTLGAWATQWELPVSTSGDTEREIWLWDFGGQSDQRLIHQLYMDETALAVLVFDGQKEDLFEVLGQWDRDLTSTSREGFTKLLVAGRIDAGGLRASRQRVEQFSLERNFARLLETSAKTGEGCDALKAAIVEGIKWEAIPWRTSPMLFKRLKDEVIKLKDAGRVLMRFNELRDSLQVQLSGQDAQFTDDELKAVVRLLAGPGAVWELQFGSWVLLQPEQINVYAQAVIQTLRDDPHERGCIDEQRVLSGDLKFQTSAKRLSEEEERIVLIAMHQTLVQRALCLREPTENGILLIFPSYYRRERPELVGHPAVQVSYRLHGFLDEIYATLVVRLHHTKSVEKDSLWRHAADFKTLTGKQLGVKLKRLGEGAGELSVYFDPTIPIEERIIFSKYVHEHVMQKARNVERLRHYVCPHCGTPAENRDVAMKRLAAWLEKRDKEPKMLCVECEERFNLWDKMEQYFASGEARQNVNKLQEEVEVILDNESKERVLVGEVISVASLAGQITREMTVSDHGIDMEIEFKSDAGEATGQKVYLQLKSGDSYLQKRARDDAEVFRIPNDRHARYWAEQSFPVILVVRSSDGRIRWMEIRQILRQSLGKTKTPPREIIFTGTRLDVMSVRGWRDKALSLHL